METTTLQCNNATRGRQIGKDKGSAQRNETRIQIVRDVQHLSKWLVCILLVICWVTKQISACVPGQRAHGATQRRMSQNGYGRRSLWPLVRAESKACASTIKGSCCAGAGEAPEEPDAFFLEAAQAGFDRVHRGAAGDLAKDWRRGGDARRSTWRGVGGNDGSVSLPGPSRVRSCSTVGEVSLVSENIAETLLSGPVAGLPLRLAHLGPGSRNRARSSSAPAARARNSSTG